MADLFDPSSPSAPPPPPPHNSFTLESDDISSLLHTLLHSSSQPSTPCIPPHLNSHHYHNQQAGSAAFSHQPGLNFQFHRPDNAFSGSIGDADCESEELEEAPVNLSQEKSSSKRSRAAEVHNLSEKRRRQKINEKMKALQKLIPNSNKTDKASMLDEAIEYLKQLQLQVQMLTLRNGSSLHPFYLPGYSQAVQQPQVGPLLDETSIGRGVGSFSGNQETSMQAMFDLSGKPPASEYKLLMPTKTSQMGKTEPPFCMETSATNEHYSSFNTSMPSKVLCKDPVVPHLQLDMSHGQSSSSGVSS